MVSTHYTSQRVSQHAQRNPKRPLGHRDDVLHMQQQLVLALEISQ
jgi:hypothetical protein